MKQRKRGALSWGVVLKLAVTIAVIGVIAWKLGGGGQLAEVLGRISSWHFVTAIAAVTLDRALMTFKWGCLLRSQTIHMPFFRGMKIYCASMIWGMFMPMTIGADAVRTYSSARTGLNASQIVASIIVERILGFFASLVMALCGFVLLSRAGVLDARFNLIAWVGGIGLLSAGVFFLLSLQPRLIEWLDRTPRRCRNLRPFQLLRELQTHYGAYRQRKGTLASFFILSIFEQLLTIFYVWLVARGFGIDVGLVYIVGALPLAILISRIPISVSGLGVFDGAFAFFMSLAGVSLAEAVAITVGTRIVETAAWLPWWLASVIQTGGLARPVWINSEIGGRPSTSN